MEAFSDRGSTFWPTIVFLPNGAGFLTIVRGTSRHQPWLLLLLVQVAWSSNVDHFTKHSAKKKREKKNNPSREKPKTKKKRGMFYAQRGLTPCT